VEFEQDRLRRAGRDDLADDVQWVSDVDGDGYRVLNLWPIASSMQAICRKRCQTTAETGDVRDF
jgi:hypothetical protein